MTARSILKSAIQTGLDLTARLTVGWPRRHASRILTYHAILPGSERCDDPYLQVSQGRLAEQIDRLLEAGFRFTTVTDLASRLTARDGGDAGIISLSFDDGLSEHLSLVVPLLRERGIPATFYVLTGRIGTKRHGGRGPDRYLEAGEVREMAAAGMEVGSHGRTHHVLGRLSAERLREEIEGSRDDLAALLGSPPRTFAYPYGSRGTYNGRVIDTLRNAGYVNAVSTIIGANRAGTPLYELRRIPVYDTDGPLLALARARGAYDWTGRFQEVWLRTFPHHSTRGGPG